ncbi:lysophospholipase D GDPD3 isoform X3 [Chelonoidis abingdonii]|uniref:lysophospholipase D GDPD3 isoform X3 n=1 Tax=Chelonoidis abingdonii TaxID=106734 RepID=UPI003F49A723
MRREDREHHGGFYSRCGPGDPAAGARLSAHAGRGRGCVPRPEPAAPGGPGPEHPGAGLCGAFSHGSDRRIPRLEEIFQKFPNVPVNVEIKQDDEELIRQVADLVRRYRRSHITVWASFQSKILEKCRAANPDMPYIFSVQRGLLLLLLYYTGLLPFVRLPESFLQFPLPSIINRTYFPVPKGCIGNLLAKFTHMVTMRKKLFKHLEDRGIQVLLWVLNEEKDFEEAFSYGVSGVMSDYPTLLRHYLDTHPPPGQDTTEE